MNMVHQNNGILTYRNIHIIEDNSNSYIQLVFQVGITKAFQKVLANTSSVVCG